LELSDSTVEAVSSLADTWIDMSNGSKHDERVRNLLIIKSRGMGHENGEQKFIITNKGIEFINSIKK
jgi:circadian clock protein KaiC